MKKLQQLCVVAVFTLVLTTTTMAGDIQTGGTPQPPPPGAWSEIAPGDIQTPGRSVQNLQATSDPVVADIALGLLQTVLAMF